MPVGIALVFEMTAPVFIALHVRFVRRQLVRRRMWVALALSVFELAFVAEVWEGGGSLDPLGVAAGLGAALPHLSPTSAGLVATVEPVFASAIAWVVLGQALYGSQVASGVVVLAGIGLAQTARKDAAPELLAETPVPLASRAGQGRAATGLGAG